MKRDYDKLLKHALTPENEPDFWLNQKILRQMEETGRMKKRTQRRFLVVATTLALTLVIAPASAYAAWKYLHPVQVAKEAQDQKLAAAFQSEAAIGVNETQSYGDYQITFLGMVSGELLTDYVTENEGNIQKNRSHIVVAIEKADGTAMPEIQDVAYEQMRFFVTPFIKGCDPHICNAYSLSGGYTDIVEDGILYRIMESENLEMFADKGIYLAVQDGISYQKDAYVFDETSGEILRNESYAGVNALFQVPMDVSKADAEAADAYLKSLFLEKSSENMADEADTAHIENTSVDAWIEKVLEGNLEEMAERVEHTVQVVTPDANGYISCKSYEIDEQGKLIKAGTYETLPTASDAEVGKVAIDSCSAGDTIDSILIYTFTKNMDGTYTYAVYVPKGK